MGSEVARLGNDKMTDGMLRLRLASGINYKSEGNRSGRLSRLQMWSSSRGIGLSLLKSRSNNGDRGVTKNWVIMGSLKHKITTDSSKFLSLSGNRVVRQLLGGFKYKTGCGHSNKRASYANNKYGGKK